MKNKLFTTIFILSLTIVLALPTAADETKRRPINQWLLLGPVSVPELETKTLKNDDKILAFNHAAISRWRPQKNGAVSWSSGGALIWRSQTYLNFDSPDTRIAYAAVYLQPSRWMKSKLVMDAVDPKLRIFLDGEELDTETEEGKTTAALNLTHEKHLLILKLLLPKGKKTNFNIALEHKKPFHNEPVTVSLSPRHRVNTAHVLNITNVTGTRVSPDGRQAAVFLSRTSADTGKTARWMEILNTATGGAVFSTENFGKIRSFKWLNRGGGFTYTRTDDDKTTIFKYDLRRRQQEPVLENIEHFSHYEWAHNDAFFIYAVSKPEENKKGYKYINHLPERSKSTPPKYALFISYPGGVTRPLTGYEQNFHTFLISPDNQKVLLQKSEPDYKNRPYTRQVYFMLDLKRLTMKRILQSHLAHCAGWSPDSRKLLFTGGPSAFNGAGKNMAKADTIPNEYDSQAYIFDLVNGNAECLSKNFDPSIDAAAWSASLNYIYFSVTDRSFARIYKYSTRGRRFTLMKTGVESARQVSFAKKRNTAVFWGCNSNVPHRLLKLNLSSNRVSLLKDYNRDAFRNTDIGKVENWDYKPKSGRTVMGRVYYPVDFSSTKKYPCIVYYYGGTSPVTRGFGGRYPMNWYAANGYIVYVLQPTGAIGFGQDASAVHVNDWGRVTSEEIVAAVNAFTRSHPFVDPNRLGAMGASYGGFLTQYLAAKTDVFAAFISHAGISSLSSYWGEGDWGYLYSAFATADSFPWNRKDIYVGHSPLFMADRIEKPLLLLHGDIDNNVPPGESYQMFAALKLLGKETALITFEGQQHFILEYKKRLQWMRTIIAWWDKHLKKQPQHWNHLYKD